MAHLLSHYFLSYIRVCPSFTMGTFQYIHYNIICQCAVIQIYLMCYLNIFFQHKTLCHPQSNAYRESLLSIHPHLITKSMLLLTVLESVQTAFSTSSIVTAMQLGLVRYNTYKLYLIFEIHWATYNRLLAHPQKDSQN